ncbi:MAG: thiamine diphosphokinase [Candidatus Riflebacteria bacterium]|nr:thiamine diphosphokinase [Candidatus Riflebacteria bacterium]
MKTEFSTAAPGEKSAISRILLAANAPREKIRVPGGSWDLVIGVDGGGDLLCKWGIKANLLIGDLDSLSENGRVFHEASGAQIKVYPADKNQTDLELALNELPASFHTEIHLSGFLGGRTDMSLLNCLLPGRFIDRGWYTFDTPDGCGGIFGAGEMIVSRLSPGISCALLALSELVEGIESSGVRWPLHYETLHLGESRGVSNIIEESQWRVRVQNGVLLWLVTGPNRADVEIERRF